MGFLLGCAFGAGVAGLATIGFLAWLAADAARRDQKGD